jgi:hypothetical protein
MSSHGGRCSHPVLGLEICSHACGACRHTSCRGLNFASVGLAPAVDEGVEHTVSGPQQSGTRSVVLFYSTGSEAPTAHTSQTQLPLPEQICSTEASQQQELTSEIASTRSHEVRAPTSISHTAPSSGTPFLLHLTRLEGTVARTPTKTSNPLIESSGRVFPQRITPVPIL